MGLDVVELVLAVEDRFEVAIADEDAARMTTPGDVADYLMARLRVDERCSSQRGFYRIRSILMKEFGKERGKIRPDTLLSGFLQGDFRHNWEKLWAAMGVGKPYPKLKYPPFLSFWVRYGFPAIFSLLSFVLLVPWHSGTDWRNSFFIAFALVVFFSVFRLFAEQVFRKMAVALPPGFQTVKDLVPYVMSTGNTLWSRKVILAEVIRLISEQTGISVEQIREGSQFIRDLGMG